MTDLKQYVSDAVRTESQIEKVKLNKQTFYELLWAYIGVGMMLDQVKKNVFYNKPFNMDVIEHCHNAFCGVDNIWNVFGHTGFEEKMHGDDELEVDPRLFHSIIGTMTESAELAQALLKAIETNSPDVTNVLEEFGDINWYQAIAHDALNTDMETTLTRNIAKLKARFPNKFTNEDAVNRNLDIERKILEGK